MKWATVKICIQITTLLLFRKHGRYFSNKDLVINGVPAGKENHDNIGKMNDNRFAKAAVKDETFGCLPNFG